MTVVYLNNAAACFDYVVGDDDRDEFDDVKVVARAICPPWYVLGQAAVPGAAWGGNS